MLALDLVEDKESKYSLTLNKGLAFRTAEEAERDTGAIVHPIG
ncbi:MAG: hypothetical protein ACFC1C_00395 [Candidatus Malihini olakiniferum]